MALHTVVGSLILFGSALIGVPSFLAFALTSHKIKEWKLS